MAKPEELEQWLRAYRPGVGFRLRGLGGGCINQVSRVVFEDGGSLVVKQNPEAPPDMFEAERVGLAALSQAAAVSQETAAVSKTGSDALGLRIPKVYGVSAHYLVLEDLGDGRPGAGFWEELGAGLARLHAAEGFGDGADDGPRFGFSTDNYCGLTRQANPPTDDGHEFFAEHRLRALGRRCREKGLLDSGDMGRLNYMAAHLKQWIPVQPAVLIHGDLWSGNIHCCSDGRPALIDPATHRGWAEAELAMTWLFGGFAPGFYDAYRETAADMGPEYALRPDWEERRNIYNLYHLLNHLLLFGGGYGRQVRGVLTRFTPAVARLGG